MNKMITGRSTSQARDFMDGIWNKHELACISEQMAHNSIIESPVRYSIGSVAFKNIMQIWLRAFPNIKYMEESLSITEDCLLLKWSVSANHLGEFYSIAPTGRKVRYGGLTKFTIKDNLICNYSAFVNVKGILSQLTSQDTVILNSNLIDSLYDAVREVLGKNLSNQQITCLALSCLNISVKEIAQFLRIEQSSVLTYLHRAFCSLGIYNKKMLIDFAIEHNAFELLTRIATTLKLQKL
ncbi:ester cyclase [Zooshikella marina]|uniref:ester cyclase n=1 Tax=Zooshikella ganghwensis TaxID=202772 RepID=UPI001BAEC70C|nr:ester cyclase [Zooshikella ganghwensis]MBU2706016.1 ester cyclase [Zooshikella ganghwensis]